MGIIGKIEGVWVTQTPHITFSAQPFFKALILTKAAFIRSNFV